jgi:hypothetical protein
MDEVQNPRDPELSVPPSDPFRKYCVMWLVFIGCGSVGALRIPCVNTVDTNVKKDKVVPAHTAKGSGGTAPLILTSTLVGVRWSTSHPGRFIPRKRTTVDCVWNVMAHAQKPYFVFRRNGRVHLNRQGLQFSRLLAAEVWASALVMLDTPCSEVVWRVLATHYIR